MAVANVDNWAKPDWLLFVWRDKNEPNGYEGLPVTLTLYGIPACDTMKKARAWLEAAGVDYAFYNYKTAGVEAARLEGWADAVGWERLLNRAGTTFRKLPDADKAGIDRDKAIALMVAQPSMIKRPVLEHGGAVTVGFDPAIYAGIFA